MKKSSHSAAPISERLANLIAGGESHFSTAEAQQVETLLVKHFRHVIRVKTCGLVRYSQRSFDFRSISCTCIKCQH